MSFLEWQNWGTERESLTERPHSLEDPGSAVSATGKRCLYLFKKAVIFQSLNFLHVESYFGGNQTNINYWACVGVGVGMGLVRLKYLFHKCHFSTLGDSEDYSIFLEP